MDAQGNVMHVYTGNSRTIGGNMEFNVYLSERNIYGSSRLGQEQVNMTLTQAAPFNYSGMLDNAYGDKRYELSNHLGNVLQVITDRKLPEDDGTNHVAHYTADVVSYSDYFPYGMQMPGRNGNDGDGYRYGFQAQEKDNEIKGTGNSYDFGNRMYDPRVGRFLSTDKFESKFAYQSSYVFAGNMPIWAVDRNGDSVWVYTETIPASGGLGRHTFMRVKTTDIDVVIELYGPDNSNNKGRPQVNPWSKGTLNRDNVLFHQVYEPINNEDPDKFERDLVKYAEYFKSNNVLDKNNNVIDNLILPTYDKWGPNSNGYIEALVNFAGGSIDLDPVYSSWGIPEIVPGLTDMLEYGVEMAKKFGADEYYQNNYGMSKNQYNKQSQLINELNKPNQNNVTDPALVRDNTTVKNAKPMVPPIKRKNQKKSD